MEVAITEQGGDQLENRSVSKEWIHSYYWYIKYSLEKERVLGNKETRLSNLKPALSSQKKNDLAAVVRRSDNFIHRINLHLVDNAVRFATTYFRFIRWIALSTLFYE